MSRRGFSVLEVIVALGILVWAGSTIATILTSNAMRIGDGHRFDEMLSLAENLLQEAVDEGWDPDEEELEWESFTDSEGQPIHEDYVWRYVRREYTPVDDEFEGSSADDQLRDKAGYTGPFMEYRVEIRLNSDAPGAGTMALWRIVPPPHPGEQMTKVDTDPGTGTP